MHIDTCHWGSLHLVLEEGDEKVLCSIQSFQSVKCTLYSDRMISGKTIAGPVLQKQDWQG